MSAITWGPEIAVNGVRPEWLRIGLCKAFVDSGDSGRRQVTAILAMLLALFIGFMILGPLGAIIGLIMAAVLILRPAPVAKERNIVEGHSAGCGCRRCLR